MGYLERIKHVRKPLIMLLIAVESKIGTLAKTFTVNRDDTQSILVSTLISLPSCASQYFNNNVMIIFVSNLTLKQEHV